MRISILLIIIHLQYKREDDHITRHPLLFNDDHRRSSTMYQWCPERRKYLRMSFWLDRTILWKWDEDIQRWFLFNMLKILRSTSVSLWRSSMWIRRMSTCCSSFIDSRLSLFEWWIRSCLSSRYIIGRIFSLLLILVSFFIRTIECMSIQSMYVDFIHIHSFVDQYSFRLSFVV